MKVLIINGSPRPQGNTKIALDEMVKIFDQEGIESEIVHVGNKDIRGCIACMSCKTRLDHCVFDDCVNEIAQKFEEADGLVVGTPVYFASANATLIAFLTRLFYSTSFDKSMKVGASAIVARRGGISSTYDEINKFFAISGMIDLNIATFLFTRSSLVSPGFCPAPADMTTIAASATSS